MPIRIGLVLCVLPLALILAGCTKEESKHTDKPTRESQEIAPPKASEEEAGIKAERAKLSPEDQKLVEAQDYCAVSPESRLGSMGVPYKLMVKGQPVFLCCEGCKRSALKNEDKTLARVVELKAKSHANNPP